MAILSIFGAAFCNGEAFADVLEAKLQWKRIDRDVLSRAARQSDTAHKNLVRAMEGPPFAFNKFTRRREKLLAQLKYALSEELSDHQIVYGFASMIIPVDIGHVLRVCLLADTEYRWRSLSSETGIDRNEAIRRIREEDMKAAQWIRRLYNTTPWDMTLYDVVIPVNETGTEGALQLIEENIRKPVLALTESSGRALEDFKLASRCELAMSNAGLFYAISCKEGIVKVTVDEYVLRMDHLESEIRQAAKGINGIKDLHVVTGPNYRPPSVFTSMDFDLPEKILLVDDEEDFVTTLSERLAMRDMEPAVVYSGEEALDLIEDEVPDVMVLDLRMPGIDGIEVLRKVRKEYPDVAVIILTGHGNEKDRKICMALGAFAYLEKPVDIEKLSMQMKRAKEFIRSRKQS